MLQKIKPNRKKSTKGGLIQREKPLVKGLLSLKYIPQDIVHIVNQGREQTINLARVTEVSKNASIEVSSKEEVEHYIKIQSSYDPKTLLNPYLHPRLIKAREAMILAVQNFNNPSIIFKTEAFCVMANIAWTYLMHEKMERTSIGSSVLGNGNSVTVSGTLDKDICPIKDEAVKANLKKIIEIRDAVEHTFFVGGEICFGALFQACCINFENYMTDWFGKELTLSENLSLALQFRKLGNDSIIEIEKSNFPKEILALQEAISNNEHKDNNAFVLKVFYTTEVTSKSNSDVHKLIDYEGSGHVTNIKKVSRNKLTQKQVIDIVHKAGFVKFTITDHKKFWQSMWPTANERNLKADKQYGENFNGWGWYEDKWMPLVLEHCKKAGIFSI